MRKTLNLSITIFRGADFAVIIEVPGPSGPLDITGYTFSGEMKSSTDPLAAVVATFTFVLSDQTLYKGQVSWSLSASASDAITPSISNAENGCRLSTPFVYDVIMTDSLGTKTRILQGNAYVSPNVT